MIYVYVVLCSSYGHDGMKPRATIPADLIYVQRYQQTTIVALSNDGKKICELCICSILNAFSYSLTAVLFMDYLMLVAADFKNIRKNF